MPKIQSWGVISVIVTLSLTIMPQLSLGQIPTLDKLNLENSQSVQCLDFNQDKICEYIVLANGTMVENPSLQTTQLEKTILETVQKPLNSDMIQDSVKVTGEGNIIDKIFRSEGYFDIRLNFGGAPSDGSLTVTNPQGPMFWVTLYRPVGIPEGHDIAASNGLLTIPFEKGTSSISILSVEAKDLRQPETQAQTVEEEKAADDNDDKTYCDVPNPSNPCHDRKDISETTGLYTCIDGSHEEDWRDCDGGGGGNNNDNENDNNNNDEESEDLPQEGGCQGDDDFCDTDEGCRSETVDCIDDRNFDEDDYNG